MFGGGPFGGGVSKVDDQIIVGTLFDILRSGFDCRCQFELLITSAHVNEAIDIISLMNRRRWRTPLSKAKYLCNTRAWMVLVNEGEVVRVRVRGIISAFMLMKGIDEVHSRLTS